MAYHQLFNDSFYDPYDHKRFTTEATTTIGDHVVKAQGGGGSIEWVHVVGYSILGLGLAVVSFLLIKQNPELADRAWDFCVRVVGRIRVLLARGDGETGEEEYEMPEVAPPLPLARAPPLNRTDSDRLAALERQVSRSTCV